MKAADSSTRDFVVGVLDAGARQLSINVAQVRSGDDAEAVHLARVATRRLRSDLKSFGPLLDDATVAHLRGELAWLGGLLGNVRDPQVLSGRLSVQMAATEPPLRPAELRRLTTLLAERAAFHRAQLLDALDGDRSASLLAAAEDLAAEPTMRRKLASRAAPPVARRLAVRQWTQARRYVRSLGDHPSDVELHEVRKRLKRARYAAQSVRPLGLGTKAFRRALADLQDLLGEHHDLVVLRDLLADEVDRLDHRSAFVAGRLAGHLDRRLARVRSQWPELRTRILALEFD